MKLARFATASDLKLFFIKRHVETPAETAAAAAAAIIVIVNNNNRQLDSAAAAAAAAAEAATRGDTFFACWKRQCCVTQKN